MIQVKSDQFQILPVSTVLCSSPMNSIYVQYTQVWAMGHTVCLYYGSVVEPFYFGPAPAPASQIGGSGSSPVFHNLLLKNFFLKNFTSQFTGTVACFIHRKVLVLGFALLLQYFI